MKAIGIFFSLQKNYRGECMSGLSNKEVAGILKEIAVLMELNGENIYKIRAYQNAARNLTSLQEELALLIEEDRLEEVKGIGKGIASTIKEIHAKGFSPLLEELKSNTPEGLLELIKIPGLGPATAHLLHRELGINNPADLKKALVEGRVGKIKGFGPKREERLLAGLQDYERYIQVQLLYDALLKAEEIKGYLEKFRELKRVETTGRLRRAEELVQEIDLLAVTDSASGLRDFFLQLPFVEEVRDEGERKISIVTEDSFQVNLFVANDEEYPIALNHYTGSREHVSRLARLAADSGYRLTETGLFKEGERIVLQDEADLYAILGLPYIIPELREGQGELEAAADGRLPESVALSDIKGDLHLHSHYSDGAHSIRELVEEARRRGYQYIAITDHSRSLKVAGGLSIEALLRQIEEIEALQEEYDDIRIFKGIEVDIDAEGNLDYPDEILARLDLVIASIHTGFNQSKEEITRRIIRAMENPHVNIIGHPTGRQLKRREAYPVDLDELIRAAGATGTWLELNSSPYRLDLDALNCRKAKEKGVKVVINTDAHYLEQFNYMLLGVLTARRGWLESPDVINTLELEELSRLLRAKSSK